MSKNDELWPNTKAWGEEKREAYYNECVPLIRGLVSQYKNVSDPAIDTKDLFQEASLAFYRAYDQYDPTRGAQFRTFAYKLMRNEINQVLRKSKASKRKPKGSVIPYDSVTKSDGDELMGGDNMEVNSGSASTMPPMDDLCARHETVAFANKLLETRFTQRERYVFLSLSQGLKNQTELANELGCSQAKISMEYNFVRITLQFELKKAGYEDV